MKIEGGAKLRRQLRALKSTSRKHITKAIRAGTEEGVRVAKVLAPERTGKTKSDIVSEYKDEGMVGVVVPIDSNAPREEKDRAYAIEYGRPQGEHGAVKGSLHMQRTRDFLEKKNKSRMSRALNKAVKEAAGRG